MGLPRRGPQKDMELFDAAYLALSDVGRRHRCPAGHVAHGTGLADPPLPGSHRALWYHPAFAPDVYRYGHRRVAAILEEIEASPYYRQFGGDEDTHSAWAFPLARNQRHYFGGRGWQPEWVVSPR